MKRTKKTEAEAWAAAAKMAKADWADEAARINFQTLLETCPHLALTIKTEKILVEKWAQTIRVWERHDACTDLHYARPASPSRPEAPK